MVGYFWMKTLRVGSGSGALGSFPLHFYRILLDVGFKAKWGSDSAEFSRPCLL